MRVCLLLAFSLFGARALWADAPPASSPIKLEAFRSDHPPFSFIYGGKSSNDFIATWQKNETTSPGEGGEIHHFTFIDPATRLELEVDVHTFSDSPALYWVIQLTNKGTGNTPILEQVRPLDWPDALASRGGECLLHLAQGGNGGPDDYQPIQRMINGGDGIRSDMGSSGTLPFFNLQHGDQGLIGAIGWSGSWLAEFKPNKTDTAVCLDAGMPATHLLLHAGETIRTPSILLLPYQGCDFYEAQNLWRRLALAHFSPRDAQGGRIDVPRTVGSWGEEPIDKKMALIKAIHDAKIPMELYWIDAGWYGDATKGWTDNRGSWSPAKKDYPNGLAPLGDLLHQFGYGFLLWMAPEQAMPGSEIATQHPDWFIPDSANRLLLKMGDPKVCQGITDFVTATLKSAGATWFRQDFDSSPHGPDDAPDRVGMTQIAYCTNFLAFWDGIRTNIPGLQIDNCDSGGKRLDIDTMQRSVSLWRSDSMVGAFDVSMEQGQAQGMIEWVPMSGGVNHGIDGATPGSAAQIYASRSTYCAGWSFGVTLPLAGNEKAQMDEYKEVQPYFYGDFYPLIDYTLATDTWAAWQLDRPELKSGCVILMRRKDSPFTTMTLPLRKIDPAATYDVEVRFGLAHVPAQKMSGADLLKLSVTVPDEPGSALVFYRKA
jgi:alpha-galactosidase